MKAAQALGELATLGASQWGMFTTAQAARRGVSRLVLTRLADTGHVERLAHGVYRNAGVPGDEFVELHAVWLSADPRRLAEERLRDGVRGTIVSGATAAWLHRMGDLRPEPFEFTTSHRRQTNRTELRYRRRALADERVTVVNGLPVTDVEQTLADLVEQRTDLSLVADALRDGVTRAEVDLDQLSELLNPLAARYGFAREDGGALLARLMRVAGIDVESVATRIAATPLGALIAAKRSNLATEERGVPPGALEAQAGITSLRGTAYRRASTTAEESSDR